MKSGAVSAVNRETQMSTEDTTTKSYQNHIVIDKFYGTMKFFSNPEDMTDYIVNFKTERIPKDMFPIRYVINLPFELYKTQPKMFLKNIEGGLRTHVLRYIKRYNTQITNTATSCKECNPYKASTSIKKAFDILSCLFQLMFLWHVIVYLHNTTYRIGKNKSRIDTLVSNAKELVDEINKMDDCLTKKARIRYMMKNCKELEGLSFPETTPKRRHCRRSCECL